MTRLRTAALPSPAPLTEEQPSPESSHFRRRVRIGRSSACVAPVRSRLGLLRLTLLLPLPTPPSPPRPGTSVLSPQRSGPCLVLPGLPWCALAACGSSHGDGSSERAVRAAGESGDRHDGPQLHPALSAGSPQGSWGLAPGPAGRFFPSPAVPAPPTRPLDLPPQPRGAFLAALRATFHSRPPLLAAPTPFPGRSGP